MKTIVIITFWMIGLLEMYSPTAHAQIRISGQVTSYDEKETIPGVNILVKGKDQGTVTDISGNYTIVAPEDGVLVFSSVGYTVKEIAVNGRTTIDIISTNFMEEFICHYNRSRLGNLAGPLSKS